jgi:hypothetical protein
MNMAIKLIARTWSACVDDYKCDFIVDSNDDFENLPKSGVGSTALSPSGAIRMVNASGEWVPFGE